MIQIKRNNKVFFTLEDFGEGSKLSYQLMDHHYIILKFTTATPIYFEIGDSVEIPDFGYFELTSAYFPKHNGSDGYDYEMQMDAYYMAWKNKLCKYRPQHGANETSFKLTTTVGVHMNVILGNLKALGLTYNGKEFSVDYTTYNNKAFDVQKRFLIEYGSISILDALNSICSEDALNCEWWIDGSIIYLGYCEMEGQTTFEQDVNVLSMSYTESKSTYITRLYAFGSDRNIPKGYFTGADADVTTDGIATDYLMLPNKEVDSDGFYAKDGYLENVNVVKNDKQAIEGVVMFEEEYPKVESVVSSIKTYDSTVDNEDGTKATQTFWQVTSTDSFTSSFKESWIKSNLTLGIKFTSGALMGMEFDVSFKVIDKVNYFEIVANDTYGRTLPDGVMCPKIGDKFFLFNWDATKITDTDLIPTAQLSLFDRSKQYYLKTMISNSNFTCTMDGEKFYNYGTYDYHPLGEQVKLINDMFAQVDADGKHYRNSRIIGMEIPLDIPYDHPQYTVGEKASSSRLGKLEDKVDSITVNGIQINGGNGGGGVYVIGTNDSTPPTDSNVLSARKSINNFLSKLKPDTAQELITFAKGLVSNMLAKLNGGAYFGNGGALIDENGNIIADSLKSIGFDKVLNEGFGMEMDGGQSHLYLANLTVWGKMMINILEIMKTKYAGGNIYMSAAGGTIVKAVPVTYINEDVGWEETSESWCDGWKCYILADDGDEATTNPWVEGDQVRCQSMGNLLGTRYAKATNKSYWRTIPEHGVSASNEYIYNDYGTPAYNGKMFYWIVLGKHSKDFDGYTEENAPTGTTDIPEAGDSIVLDGSRKDTSRQGVLQLSSYGSGAPSIVGLRGVSDYTHENCAIFELSYDYVRIFAERFKLIAKNNKVVEITNFRGEWDPTEKYYKNDQVSHNNAIWTCLSANNGTEPTDGSRYWRKEVYGMKGDKGNPGADGTDGIDGTNGEDAISILVEDAPLIFDAGTNGIVPSNIAKSAKVKVMKGNVNVTNAITAASSNDEISVNCNSVLTMRTDSSGPFLNVEISSNNIATTWLNENDHSKGVVSVTSGYATGSFAYNNKAYKFHVPFEVNVSKFTGQLMLTTEKFSTEMSELSGKHNTLSDNYDRLAADLKTSSPSILTNYTSKIEQTARQISLTVSEKSIARRNLLVGSAFLREDNNFRLFSDARIEMNSGYQGTNCIKCIDDTTDGKTRYPGVFWDASLGGKSVRITKGKKYVISCWYFSNNANGHLSLEALYIDKRTNERKGAPKYLSAGSFSPKPHQWQLFSTVIDTTDAEYDYIAFNFYEHCGFESGLIEAYICRPMVEEGDTYNGWTLSQDDYDIIGSNLIDNSRTLDVGSNVLEVKGQKALVGDAYELTYIGSDDYNTFYRIKGSTFQFGVDYTISFEVRGDAEYMGVYAYYPITNTKFTFYAEPQNGVMTEVTDGGKVNNYVALIEFKELSKQQRVWSHFRFKDRLPDYIYFQFPKNAEQTGVTSWSVTITRPKIEVGAVVTEFTERKSDLIDKASLKAAGIVVDSESVTLYGNQVHIKKNKTDANDTVIIDNATGKVSAGLIDADKVVAKGIQAKNLEATNLNVTGNSRFGIWEIVKDDTFGEMIQARGDLTLPSGTTASGSGINYLPLYIRGGKADINYFRVGVSCTEFSYLYGNDFCGVWTGKAADYVCGGTDTVFNTPTGYVYNTSYHPAEYIYATKSSPNDPAFAINVVKTKDSSDGTRTAIQTNGAIRGVIAPNLRIMNYSGKISSSDCIVVATASNITLTLPPHPVTGQTLIIFAKATNVYIQCNGTEKMYANGKEQTKIDIGRAGNFTYFFFDGTNWCYSYFDGSHNSK